MITKIIFRETKFADNFAEVELPTEAKIVKVKFKEKSGKLKIWALCHDDQNQNPTYFVKCKSGEAVNGLITYITTIGRHHIFQVYGNRRK